jgi:hypothetical protein
VSFELSAEILLKAFSIFAKEKFIVGEKLLWNVNKVYETRKLIEKQKNFLKKNKLNFAFKTIFIHAKKLKSMRSVVIVFLVATKRFVRKLLRCKYRHFH